MPYCLCFCSNDQGATQFLANLPVLKVVSPAGYLHSAVHCDRYINSSSGSVSCKKDLRCNRPEEEDYMDFLPRAVRVHFSPTHSLTNTDCVLSSSGYTSGECSNVTCLGMGSWTTGAFKKDEDKIILHTVSCHLLCKASVQSWSSL